MKCNIEDCVSRAEVLNLHQMKLGAKEIYKAIYDLPPVYLKRECEAENCISRSDDFEEWKLNEDKDCYLRIGDIVDRFKEIDEHYNHSPWNLTQIFSNLNVLQRFECEAEDCISRTYLIDHCVYDLDNNMVCDLDDIRNAPSIYPKSEIKVEDMGRYDPYTDKFIKE